MSDTFETILRRLLSRAPTLVLLVLSGCPGGSGGPTKIECGGGAKFACPSGFFCDLGDRCGGIDQKGYCRPIPSDCPMTEAPVCSCDKTNYRNECYANASGETVAYPGKCLVESH